MKLSTWMGRKPMWALVRVIETIVRENILNQIKSYVCFLFSLTLQKRPYIWLLCRVGDGVKKVFFFATYLIFLRKKNIWMCQYMIIYDKIEYFNSNLGIYILKICICLPSGINIFKICLPYLRHRFLYEQQNAVHRDDWNCRAIHSNQTKFGYTEEVGQSTVITPKASAVTLTQVAPLTKDFHQGKSCG